MRVVGVVRHACEHDEHAEPRRSLAVAAIAIAVLGTVVGTVLHHAHPFGYG